MRLQLYGKAVCDLCQQAKTLLELLQNDYRFDIEEIDIYSDEQLLEKYHIAIPVLEHNGMIIDSGNIDLETVENYLKKQNNIENS